MEVGGQAADQMARTSIHLSEESLKLLAGGAKNLTAFLIALSKDNQKVAGKTNLRRLLREGKEHVVFHIRLQDFDTFRKHAKQYGILYSGIKCKQNTTGLMDVISNVDHVSQINRVLEIMGYPVPKKTEVETSKKVQTRAPHEKCSPERGSGSMPSRRKPINEKPSVRGRLAALAAATKGMKKIHEREHIHMR